MDSWVTALGALAIGAVFHFVLSRILWRKQKLPPGPLALPLIGNPIWLFKPLSELEATLRHYHSKYGPVITLHFGNTPSIFIASHSAAHQALVQNGAVFADRFPIMETVKIITSNQRNISTSFYGPTWRILRRNLTSELLHPSRLKAHSPSRKWVLDDLLHRLIQHSHPTSPAQSPVPVTVVDHLRHAMFSLAAAMCFGERFDAKLINEIQESQRGVLLNIGKFNDLNFWPPKLGKILFRKRWEEIRQLRKRQDSLLLPLINARKKIVKEKGGSGAGNKNPIPYVDTLFDLEIAENNDEKRKRKLVEDELITLCTEFIDAITDTTVVSVQWIMANLVKYPEIQEKLFKEMKEVMGESAKEEIEEEDLQKMTYLKAVVLEGLRRHPPGHLLLPHTVTEDSVVEGGYRVPKGTSVNFMVADMGWDPKVWPDPMAFKPERFLTDRSEGGVEVEVDITGSKEIKMMPFGAGRRFCPGFALGLLHLEYFVGNLVWNFKWTAAGDVDLSEKLESAVTMKQPLLSYLSPRAVSS
ncbi:cytochrome P450 89A2-like [Cucurbita moschata]|uniref:Cytochrome P450 89A2-like n=1 Tax=Cucurbita moschata TaxID=3662 RepID=A0A6J1GMN6_CUCMO|nr:cytochrome P450 89A2-like [Cucurbita moschata]